MNTQVALYLNQKKALIMLELIHTDSVKRYIQLTDQLADIIDAERAMDLDVIKEKAQQEHEQEQEQEQIIPAVETPKKRKWWEKLFYGDEDECWRY